MINTAVHHMMKPKHSRYPFLHLYLIRFTVSFRTQARLVGPVHGEEPMRLEHRRVQSNFIPTMARFSRGTNAYRSM